ncbi:MAG: hypothetical protein Q7R75_01055 [bacterium]|nr:hypothetical protein [bacterium]
MMYAHIFKSQEKYYVWYRYPFKFNGDEEEKMLEEKIEITLFEESGDFTFLDKQIANWMEARGIDSLGGFSGMNRIAPTLTNEEYIQMLRQEAYRTAALLEMERKEKKENMKKFLDLSRESTKSFREEIFGLADLVKMQDTIMEDAGKRGCGCVDKARARFGISIVWN